MHFNPHATICCSQSDESSHVWDYFLHKSTIYTQYKNGLYYPNQNCLHWYQEEFLHFRMWNWPASFSDPSNLREAFGVTFCAFCHLEQILMNIVIYVKNSQTMAINKSVFLPVSFRKRNAGEHKKFWLQSETRS